jgi:hypothetical protein
MRTTHFWTSSMVVAVAIAVHAGNVYADTAQEDAAELRFQEALALMKAGNFAAACPKLVESQRLDPAVGTLLYLGECYDRNGQTALAWATFMAAAESARRDNQPEREKTALDRANDLIARVSKLTIEVAPEARVEGLQVKLDGTVMSESDWGVATALDPGNHSIEATAPGRIPWSSKVTISPRRTQYSLVVPVLVSGTPGVPLPPAMAVQSPVPQKQARTDWTFLPQRAPETDSGTNDGSTQRLVGIATGGVGVAGFAVGAIFGLVAKSKESDSRQYCSPTDDTSCNHEGYLMIRDAKRDATIANVGFVVGGLGLVTGAVLYLTAPKSSSSKPAMQTSSLRIAPLLAPTVAGFAVAGQY